MNFPQDFKGCSSSDHLIPLIIILQFLHLYNRYINIYRFVISFNLLKENFCFWQQGWGAEWNNSVLFTSIDILHITEVYLEPVFIELKSIWETSVLFGSLHQGEVGGSEGTKYSVVVSCVPGAAFYSTAVVTLKTGLRGKLRVIT